jgi:hypothetical protein
MVCDVLIVIILIILYQSFWITFDNHFAIVSWEVLAALAVTTVIINGVATFHWVQKFFRDTSLCGFVATLAQAVLIICGLLEESSQRCQFGCHH